MKLFHPSAWILGFCITLAVMLGCTKPEPVVVHSGPTDYRYTTYQFGDNINVFLVYFYINGELDRTATVEVNCQIRSVQRVNPTGTAIPEENVAFAANAVCALNPAKSF